MSASTSVIKSIGGSAGNLMKCKKLLTSRATVHDYKHAELQHTREPKQEIDNLSESQRLWKLLLQLRCTLRLRNSNKAGSHHTS